MNDKIIYLCIQIPKHESCDIRSHSQESRLQQFLHAGKSSCDDGSGQRWPERSEAVKFF